MLDAHRWQRLWKRLGGRGDASTVFAELLAAYSQPHRAYHNAAHIDDGLRQFDSARELAERPDEVEAAIWFHDAIYDPRAADNEEQSAAWAARIFETHAAPIASLILATKHDREPHNADGAILLDVDLSILGRDPETFAAYDLAIREEYRWVLEPQFRAGRVAILERFLARPKIYRTEFFRERFEVQARHNIVRALSSLKPPGQPDE